MRVRAEWSITPRRVVIAAVAVWSICVVLQWLTNPPLSHDEAAYALLARDGQHQWLYRPIGTIAIARIGLWFGEGELALRVPSMMLGLSLVPAVAFLGRRFGPWTGAWAAAVVAGSHTFLMRGFQLLNDVPVTACILVATAIAIDELEREHGPSYRLVWIAPLCAAAVYMRYGSTLVIGAVAIVAMLRWRSWLRRLGPVFVTIVVFIALLAPLLVYSYERTGELLGLFERARAAATYPVGQGFSRFVLGNPFMTYGALVAPTIVVGLVAGVVQRDSRVQLLALASIAIVVWLGLRSDGSARLLFVPIVFLVILGVRAIARTEMTPMIARTAAALVVVTWLAMITAVVPIQRYIERGLAVMITASETIRADAAGRPCVVAAYWVTQLMWYSGCRAAKAPTWETIRMPPGEARWYAASMPRHPVQPDRIARNLDVTPVALPGGAAWRLVRNAGSSAHD